MIHTTTHPHLRRFSSIPRRLAISWHEFRTRYTDEALPFMKDSTQGKIAGVFDSVERIAKPRNLSDLDASAISRWAAARKQEGVADATIKGNLAVIQAALKWAVEQGLLRECPRINAPKRAKAQKLMKGRPITEAEYERMLAACDTPGLRFLITGLWLSGLRLSEALSLSWDASSPDCLTVDFNGKYPMFKVPASEEKGNTDRLLPMAPECARWLLETPESDRTGKVFKVPFRSLEDASRAITALGEAAGVVVDAKTRKWASAHDLRRSFGERWAMKVMPAVLMALMRHESIDTTMRFYVGQQSQALAEAIWAAS